MFWFWFLREKCEYNSELSSAAGCHPFSLLQGALWKVYKTYLGFWAFSQSHKITNTNIPAFLLHRKSVCFGAAVSCVAATAAFSGSSCCLCRLKRDFTSKSGKVGGFRKFWRLDFFPCICQARRCYFPGQNCRREKMQIMGKAGLPRKGWYGCLFFLFPEFSVLVFFFSPNKLTQLWLLSPFWGESLQLPRPLEACFGGKWWSMIT